MDTNTHSNLFAVLAIKMKMMITMIIIILSIRSYYFPLLFYFM